ncbi:hypothetical protein [Vibrio sp. SCSIO 43137]|uniref:hypothetical protein n=1 Tax=Vibrio sp. SCSIO 43137 TaxID=3021011 RepID=UPI0023070AF0|nr:hypothetical protein [Vibrio sp. SCSIO 43137]WCE31157.1 hypothetical protein PK654_07795 [Vibrio sp. SCSIO 43137]
MKDVQQAFNSLVTNDFSNASFDDVKAVALAMWHEEFVPSVDGLSEQSARSAGYLVDKLMRYNCVNDEVKALLRIQVMKLKSTATVVPTEDRKCEKLARSWGLHQDLKLQVRQLLEYQTRHYVHYH